jgi:ankyrin repeat protein
VTLLLPVENHAQTISSCDGNQIEATQLEQTSANSNDSTTPDITSSIVPSSLSSTTSRIMSPPGVRRTFSLMDMARMQQWSALVAHVNRKEAKHPDGDGLYPLHWACSGGAPIEVVDALLQAYPRASRKVDREGSTVLHFACHYGASSAVVARLLQEYPKATKKKDKFGRTPLYHAVTKSANGEVMEKLIQADPSSVTMACHPAAAAASQMEALNIHSPLYLAWVGIMRDRQAQQRRSGKKWNKAQLLLEAAYFHHLETDASAGKKPDAETCFRMIPAVITMSSFLPHPVLELAILAFPEQVREQDPITGRLPLHMAASMMEPHRADNAIRLLLQTYSEAAQQLDAAHKQTALVLAIESGKRWDQGLERLFRAGPDRLHTRDIRSGLAPAILAATATPPAAAANNASSETTITTNPAKDDLPSYGLALTTTRRIKDLEWKNHLQRKRLQPDEVSSNSRNPDALHVSTIYELLLQDPSILAA